MAVAASLLDEDAFAVKSVDAHLAGGVDDAAVAHTDTHMDNATLGVLEESQVVALHITKTHLVATGHLLRGVAREPDAQCFKADLRETTAVDAACAAAAPQVGGAKEEALGQVGGILEGDILLVVNPPAVAVVVALHETPFFLSFNDFHSLALQHLADHLAAVAGFGPHGHGT